MSTLISTCICVFNHYHYLFVYVKITICQNNNVYKYVVTDDFNYTMIFSLRFKIYNFELHCFIIIK